MEKIDLDYFEKVLIYKSLTDERYLADIISHVEPSIIANKNIKVIFTIIKDFYNKRGVPPTTTELKTYLVNDEVKDAFRSVAGVFSEIDKNLNKDELLENTERYLKERSIYHTMMDVAEDITQGKVDTSYILERFEKSCQIDLKNDIGLDLFENIDTLIDEITTDQPVIPTLWPWLDEKLDGGFKSNGRAFYVFAGQTNVGKSIFLGNIAANMSRQGKNVVIISLEMSDIMYGCRVVSDVTKIPIANLADEAVTLKHTITEMNKSPNNGKILIKEFPPNTISSQQIASYIKTLQLKGIKIDAIVLDYINLIKGSMNTNMYERIKSAAEEIRALTYKFNCPIISATQLNRTGYDVDTPKLDSIGESIGLAATADVIVGITQSDEDKELNIINIHMMKNRFGQNFGSNQMRMDFKTLTVHEDDSLNDDDGDLGEVSNMLDMLSN
jgi:replicative DNA helicase|tara:strand:+ start:818 stop:2143 length:1326 start_codon:yes stop_codon:yes gene_type:complete